MKELQESLGQLVFWATVFAWVLIALIWLFPENCADPEYNHLRARIEKLERP